MARPTGWSTLMNLYIRFLICKGKVQVRYKTLNKTISLVLPSQCIPGLKYALWLFNLLYHIWFEFKTEYTNSDHYEHQLSELINKSDTPYLEIYFAQNSQIK